MRSSGNDDRTTRARIRDAAIECFAAAGIAGTSIRTIAAVAGVSPGLVIHHFGSKDGLRTACDQHAAAVIRELKGNAMATGVSFDPLAALRSQASGVPINKYLARTLVDGSAQVDNLVDEIVDDAVAYMATGVETGMIKPSRYPRERAAILAIWSLGALVLHEHLERLTGVDITTQLTSDPKAASNYVAPALELAGGFITEATRDMMASAFVDASEQQESASR
jgi:AcrR family transcriptional regulator